jgi:hypothetical protein
MALTDRQTRELVARFKASVASDLYSSTDIVDLEAAKMEVAEYAAEIRALEHLLNDGPLQRKGLADVLLVQSRVYDLLCLLLSITSSIELEDGRKLPSSNAPPRTEEEALATASVLVELGLPQLLSDHADIGKLLLVVAIREDAARRRFRVDAKIKRRITTAINSAIIAANADSHWLLDIGENAMVPMGARRIVEYVITIDGEPRIGIASTFQAYSGGRQAREMRTLYPSVQASLANSGMSLVLLADGQGMRAISERVLFELFKAVPYTMSLSQAESGGLARALVDLSFPPEQPSIDTAGLRKLIASALDEGVSVAAASLPVGEGIARLALANYASANNHLALRLAPDGMALGWERADSVRTFRHLRWSFDGPEAIQQLIKLLGGKEAIDVPNSTAFSATVAELPDDPVFRWPFVLAAIPEAASVAVLRDLAKHALESSPESRLAVLITHGRLTPFLLSELRGIQGLLPVTIVVVDIDTCLIMAQSQEPARGRLGALLLEQTDLAKLSPFVVRGATPSRVFFGREAEEAELLSTLPTNSIALLGARRIGKTSLILHSFDRLKAANIQPFFGDCQIVRTWADFGEMASRNWHIQLPGDFKPQHLFDLVDKLRSDSFGHPIVLMLDEIDQLLDWDKTHTEVEVPEAFFRACRSISQQGIAQFVFSGERIIANRMWDAASPHWNFCRPVMLLQLTPAAAASLMADPLEALGVRIEDPDAFIRSCWIATDGHPELLQLLGDRIVNLINQRDRSDIFTSQEDVQQITRQYKYAEQYLETYWGQATPLERIVSVSLIDGPKTIEQIISTLESIVPHIEGDALRSALHMLELYGIAEQAQATYQLRALWFTQALTFYGGQEMTTKRYADLVQP